MPNKQYLRGRRLEYYFLKLGKQHGWQTIRASGSHGFADIVWFRLSGIGTVNEGLEHIHSAGWFPMTDLTHVPDPFIYGYWRYTRGLNKHYIWVLPVGDGYGQVLLIQCKSKLGRKKT